MKKYKYLIIGGGMAADAAARGIRELDANGPLAILGKEPDPPYRRPMLSKGLWKGGPLEKIWRKTETIEADLILGRQAVALDPSKRRVRDDQNEEYGYEKLLLVTGGTPRRLPFAEEGIIYFRTLQHYIQLRALADQADKNFAVIGGGFIGTELAAALTMNGRKVVMLIKDQAIGSKAFPADLAGWLNDYYREKGVELVPGDAVTSCTRRGERFELQTQGGRTFEVNGVVAGIGIQPNVELAQAAGLKLEDGVVVDDQLRTSAADIFAAGDIAMFPHKLLGKSTRVEHEDNALKSGKLAGRNMAGAGESYTHAPYFYSDLFDLGYEAVGELDSRLETISDWQEPFRKGVVYYLDQGRVRGVLLWNIWKKVEAASALLAEPGPFRAQDLQGRITG
jgi:NADPH-dependent 2,4-dienoyl-CoA reductase/sulfur reductase-like enzyme